MADVSCICSHLMAALFCVKWRYGYRLEVLNVRVRQSMHTYLLREQSCQIASQSNLKRQGLRFCCRGHHNKNNKIRDQFLIQQAQQQQSHMTFHSAVVNMMSTAGYASKSTPVSMACRRWSGSAAHERPETSGQFNVRTEQDKSMHCSLVSLLSYNKTKQR